jgi:hypothetical protein
LGCEVVRSSRIFISTLIINKSMNALQVCNIKHRSSKPARSRPTIHWSTQSIAVLVERQAVLRLMLAHINPNQISICRTTSFGDGASTSDKRNKKAWLVTCVRRPRNLLRRPDMEVMGLVQTDRGTVDAIDSKL